MKIAAIDIGSNSVHLIIARVSEQGVIEVIDQDKEVARLGEGTLSSGALGDSAMERGLRALGHFKRLAERHQVDALIAVATSAVREARNGGYFIEQVRAETGIEVRVISGREEARLIYLGARDVLDFRGRKALILDPGGGSLEFMLGDAERLIHAESLKLGVIRLTERFQSQEQLSKETRKQLEAYIEGNAEAVVQALRQRGFDFLVGTSGTMLNVIGMAAALSQDGSPGRLGGLSVSRDQVLAAMKKVLGTPRAERAKLPGLDPRRVDTILAGAVLVHTLMRQLGAETLTACDRALREGLVVDYIAQHRPGIRLVDEVPDVRRRSVLQLATRCNAHSEHTQQVARLADQLFQALAPLHQLTSTDAELLEFGALLLDVGYLISAEAHHKHGYYLICNGQLEGFSPSEVLVLANIVRYHRKALPSSRHDGYAQLSSPDRRRVCLLGGMLRLAAALDRSRAAVVSDLTCRISPKRLEVLVEALDDAQLELWVANRRSDLLELALELPVLVLAARAGHPSAEFFPSPDDGGQPGPGTGNPSTAGLELRDRGPLGDLAIKP